MRILFYGAGVIGSVYAARLKDSGHEVSILARGTRLAMIRNEGIMLEDVISGVKTKTPVNAVENLSVDDSYDLVVVCVEKHQLASILPSLVANKHVENILLMLNNAEGLDRVMSSVGRERILGGFPGVGGRLDGDTVRYLPIKQQSTVIAEPDGRTTQRLDRIVAAFKDAGFRIEITRKINAWLKTHAVFVTCIESAIYLSEGDNNKLAQSSDGLSLMVDGIREGFKALQSLNIPITPSKLMFMFVLMPKRYPVSYWRRELKGKLGEYSLAPHTNASIDEVRELVNEVRAIVRTSSVPTPALNRLYSWTDSPKP